MTEKNIRLGKTQSASSSFNVPERPRQAPQPHSMPVQPGTVYRPTGGYTDAELAVLSGIPGWSPEQGVPAELPEILQKTLRAEAAAAAKGAQPDNLQPPVPLDTPPLKVPEPIRFSDLSEAQQATLAAEFAEAQERAATLHQRRMEAMSASTPASVADAAAGRNIRSIDIDITTDEPAKPEGQPAPSPQVTPEKPSRTGADVSLRYCTHCHHDLTLPAVPEPTEDEKTNYLIAILGQKPFSKTYSLFGNRLEITIRELSIAELDACYKQVRLDTNNGDVATSIDYEEALQQYRLSLQLVQIRDVNGNTTNFPNSLDEWVAESGVRNEKNRTVLADIRDAVHENFTSESFYRAVRNEVLRFNRLVSKLEVSADNENFYKAAR